jgi:riboflavin kinase/FMN adenylyltransferase
MKSFTARTIRGAGRGKGLQYPTINLDLRDVPADIEDGIYACLAILDDEANTRNAVVHVGPRPVFQDDRSFEVHLLDSDVQTSPEQVTVTLIGERIREIRDFPSVDALTQAIKEDIVAARAMLSTHASGD